MTTERLLTLADVLDATAKKLRDIVALWSEHVHPRDRRSIINPLYRLCTEMEKTATHIREGRFDEPS